MENPVIDLTRKDKIEICRILIEKEGKELEKFKALSNGKASYYTAKVESLNVNIAALEMYLRKLEKGEAK